MDRRAVHGPSRPAGRGRRPDPRHPRLAAGPRSAGQDARRSRRCRRDRGAGLPRCDPGARAVRAPLRGDPRRRARHAGRGARRASRRRAAAEARLRRAQLPQPVRSHALARAPAPARPARESLRVAHRRGRPVRRHPLRRLTAAAGGVFHRTCRATSARSRRSSPLGSGSAG